MGTEADPVLRRTMAHVAVEREIAALTTDEALLARCVTEAPDFSLTNETFEGRAMLVARWTDRVGGKRGLQLGAGPDARDSLLNACLYRMLLRDIAKGTQA